MRMFKAISDYRQLLIKLAFLILVPLQLPCRINQKMFHQATVQIIA